MKNLYFLSGLPRSGNTLLSALLNQNPEIYVSPISPLFEDLLTLEKLWAKDIYTSNFELNTTSGLKRFAEGFYENIEKPIILDRNKEWGSKESIYTMYKYLTEKPKIVYTVRDIPSILASFMSIVKDDGNNFIDESIRKEKINPYGNQETVDVRCDWLMNNQVGYCLSNLTQLLKIKVPVCLIEYDDLVQEPQMQLAKIYDFLEIKGFDHSFDNVVKLEEENLALAGLPANLHDVRGQVQKTSRPASVVLTKNVMQKYSNLEFWRNNENNIYTLN